MKLPCSSLLLMAAMVAGGDTLGAEEAVRFKNRRELFVDSFLVQETNAVEYRLGVPHSAGTALKLDRPWEGRWGAYVSVISNDQKFLMYYRVLLLQMDTHKVTDEAVERGVEGDIRQCAGG